MRLTLFLLAAIYVAFTLPLSISRTLFHAERACLVGIESQSEGQP